MLRKSQGGILPQKVFRTPFGRLHQGLILRNPCQFELQQAALARAQQISGAAQGEVDVGNFKAVVGAAHRFHAHSGVVGQLGARHQNAVALVRPPAHPTAQLVQLAESKTLGVLNDHDAGVGHVHAHLNDGGGHHDLGFPAHKTLHFVVFVRRFHPTVHNAHGVLRRRKVAPDALVTVHQVLVIQGLRLLNERIHQVDLTPQRNLLFEEAPNAEPVAVRAVHRFNGFAAGRQFVDHGTIQIPVSAHGQGARNGGGGHHQHVRRDGALFPQCSALGHAKPVLFVHNRQSQLGKGHAVLQQGVGAHDEIHFSGGQIGQNPVALGGFGAAGEEFQLQVHGLRVGKEPSVVLLGQNFRGGHQAGLGAVVFGQEHAQKGHHGLSGTHVALEESVHLEAGPDVLANFPNHAFLRLRQFKRQLVFVKMQKIRSDAVKYTPAVGFLALGFLHLQPHLQQKQFFKGQALPRGGKGVGVRGEVHAAHGFVPNGPVELAEPVFRQPLRYVGRVQVDGGSCNEFGQPAGVKPAGGEFLRGGIDREQSPHGPLAEVGPLFHLRMGDVSFVLEGGDFAVHHYFFVQGQAGFDPLGALKPNQFQGSGGVFKLRYNPFFWSGPGFRQARNGAPELNLCGPLHCLRHRVKLRAVHVAKGVVLEQIAHGAQAQFSRQKRGALRPHPFEVLQRTVPHSHAQK